MGHGRSSSPYTRLALTAFALTLAACTNTSTPPPRELAGRYELVGVMEMGSQLLLHEQGMFEAVLYYGSLDIQGRGRWAMVDGQIELRERGLRAFIDGMRLVPSGNCLLVDMDTSTGCYRRR
ncbi:hypothetical protein [Stutzerimonas stutzeri]|uniref:Lipoprotein n=1 Tax=Stutzerimonas stutzeri TaxID=316 RepID=A0A2N8RI42_STUST|nr:hypothetical protein [Stutzerimonas stutzeri]MCQ4253018.1 hypothetical protein [Stutzerimonas stutzeri]PNF60753.1 hypothetical protein CXK99_05880 [Stutzerimonas stutzeri]